jgi:hypothetical protein
MKRWAILTVLISIAPIGLVAFWGMQPTDPINAVNFDRIQDGMTITEVEQILGSAGEEAQGEFHSIPLNWQGRGRNAITVYFARRTDGRIDVIFKYFFNPTIWDHVKEWWAGYELHPDGGRSKQFESAA